LLRSSSLRRVYVDYYFYIQVANCVRDEINLRYGVIVITLSVVLRRYRIRGIRFAFSV